MEWLFRRHFWIVHLAFVALAAIVLASVVNLVLELWITGLQPSSPASVASTSRFGDARNFDLANTRNLFQAKRDVIIPNQRAGNCDNWKAAKQSSLGLKLVGSAIFEDPKESLAFIEDTGRRGPAAAYSINECDRGFGSMSDELLDILGPSAGASVAPCNRLDSAVVKRIAWDPDYGERVYIYNETSGQCEYLATGTKLPGPSFPKPLPPRTLPSAQFGNSIKQLAENSFEIQGSDLDGILNNLSVLLTQARTVPAFEDGKPVGFRFESIQPGSIFEKIGFKKGDVLNKINGYDVSPEKALELLQKLQSDTQFSVQGKRSGEQFNYDYTIKR